MALWRIVREIAEHDVISLANYLSRKVEALGLRFLDKTDETFEMITEAPGMGSPYDSRRRRLQQLRFQPVLGFPHHLIFYAERDDHIIVLRVMHSSRNVETELRFDPDLK